MTPEQHPQAEEAARYVLGQLSPSAQHQFEIELTQSAELRALVQELEEGIEATARTVPQRPPPPQTWTAIEKAIAQEIDRKVITPSFWANWWRSGWAAAAACLVAFLSYAWWPSRPEPIAANPPTTPTEPVVTASTMVEPKSDNPLVARITKSSSNITVMPASVSPSSEPVNPELASLRWQITALRTQLEELSQVVSQQKTLLTEPGRFKFFPLTDNRPTETGDTTPTPMSPGLQRAMFYAMARDMGWVARTATAESQNNTANPSTATTTAWGVDFVDISKSTGSSAASSSSTASTTATAQAETQTATASISIRPGGTIPGYLGENGMFVMALDSTLVPKDSRVFIWNGTATEGYHVLGNTTLRDNPMVISLPSDVIANGDLMVTAVPANGASNVIGNFQVFRHTFSAPR